MLTAALRDLQWRRQRFVIAIVATGLVFAATLVLTGLANGFQVEASQTVDSMRIDSYLVKSGAAGPFVGSTPFPATELQTAATIPGVATAIPLLFSTATVTEGGSARNVLMFGEGTPGMPALSAGRAPQNPDEIAASSRLGRRVGDNLDIASRNLAIVGIVSDSTALGGQPNVFLTMPGAQRLMFGGQPLLSSIGIRGTPAEVPVGYRLIDRADAVNDLLRQVKVAYGAITFIAVLLWVVAALIVGSVIYLSALERSRDFAVFKAVGISTGSVLGGLILQALIVAILSAVVGALLALVLAPLFPMRVVVPQAAFLLLPVLAVVVGLLASVAGIRRAVSIDPALAFGGP
ncbi:MAG: FtsX-like permease family protein [Mycolicibacterium sp.]|nr:FtsX-like permease family protein [Mycolicibacterium sp.]